jgi:quinol monooxygenase YgiN
MSKISYVVQWAIKDGQLEAFKSKADGFIEAVKAKEPGTLAYQWWIAEDGRHCLLHETFESSEALLTHLGNVGPSLPDLLEIAPASRMEVYGDASPDVREALAGFDAAHFAHYGGFER